MNLWNRHDKGSFSAYLNGELSAEITVQLEEHLQTCDSCKRDLEKIKEGAMFARSLKRVEAPPTLWSAINKQLEVAPRSGRFQRMALSVPFAMRTAVSVGVLFVACLIMIYFARITSRDVEPHSMDLDPYLALIENAKPDQINNILSTAADGLRSTTWRHALAVAQFKEIGEAFPGNGYRVAAQNVRIIDSTEIAQIIFQRNDEVVAVFIVPRSVKVALGGSTPKRDTIGSTHGGKLERGPLLVFLWGTPEINCVFITRAGSEASLQPLLEAFQKAYHPSQRRG